MSSNKFFECTLLEKEKIFFSWEIQNSSFIKMDNVYTKITSEWFSKWHFRLVITGDSYGMKVTLENNCTSRELIGIFTLSIKDKEDKSKHSFSSKYTKIEFKSWNELLFADDILILNCEIELPLEKKSVHYTNNYTHNNAFGDLDVFLDTKELADVTIVSSDGVKIPAHKIILSARSKVFAAMFKHPLDERENNCVAISDFSSNVINGLLQFIYTGKSPNLNGMNADLMAAADKYNVDELKALCAQSMSDNLSPYTAPIVLKSADLHSIDDLKSEAIRFIGANLRKVSETSTWMDLVTTDRNLVSEVFTRLDELYLNAQI